MRALELLAVAEVEREGLRVVDISRGMNKSPDTVAKAISRGVRHRTVNEARRV